MKELIKQFYTEGFATTFINKPVNEVKKCTKNRKVISISTFIIKLFYTLIFIAIAAYVLYDKLPI